MQEQVLGSLTVPLFIGFLPAERRPARSELPKVRDSGFKFTGTFFPWSGTGQRTEGNSAPTHLGCWKRDYPHFTDEEAEALSM